MMETTSGRSRIHIVDQNGKERDSMVYVPAKEDVKGESTTLDSGDISTSRMVDRDPPELCGACHLQPEQIVFEGEISEIDGFLNFYLACWFDVDRVFGTHVETSENEDWINVYANYDMREHRVQDTLDVIFHKGDGTDQEYVYRLDVKEQSAFLDKMESYCKERTGLDLIAFCEELREPEEFPVMKQRI